MQSVSKSFKLRNAVIIPRTESDQMQGSYTSRDISVLLQTLKACDIRWCTHEGAYSLRPLSHHPPEECGLSFVSPNENGTLQIQFGLGTGFRLAYHVTQYKMEATRRLCLLAIFCCLPSCFGE